VGKKILVLMGHGMTPDKGEITLFDVAGKRITSRKVAPSQTAPVSFDVSLLPVGMYFVRLKMEKENKIAKFLVQ
jgi:hypothetical protein